MMKKLCVLIRSEGLTVAQQAVQAGHAVAEWLLHDPQGWQGWRNEILIYTQVPKEEDLLSYAAIFNLKGIKYILYQDTDLDAKYTALATADVKAFSITKKLPLFKGC